MTFLIGASDSSTGVSYSGPATKERWQRFVDIMQEKGCWVITQEPVESYEKIFKIAYSNKFFKGYFELHNIPHLPENGRIRFYLTDGGMSGMGLKQALFRFTALLPENIRIINRTATRALKDQQCLDFDWSYRGDGDEKVLLVGKSR